MAKRVNAPKGMILLKRGNRILEETVRAQIMRDPEEKKPSHFDVKLCDFDEVAYSINIDSKEENAPMAIKIMVPCYPSIREMGSLARLKEVFGDLIASEDDDDDVILHIDLDNLPSDKAEKEKLIQNIATLKYTLMSGPFVQFFTDLKNGKAKDPWKYDIRSDTTVYFCPKNDRCTIVFGIDYAEKVDKIIAGVILQELVESKRRIRSAPPFSFNKNPPKELQDHGVTKNEGDILGFASIAVLPNHVKDLSKMDNAVGALINFRTFLQYHIKCAKSYFHSRMRARCADLLKILNRAKVKFGVKAKKTKSGKTFTRHD